jgi:hypothetical protein
VAVAFDVTRVGWVTAVGVTRRTEVAVGTTVAQVT